MTDPREIAGALRALADKIDPPHAHDPVTHALQGGHAETHVVAPMPGQPDRLAVTPARDANPYSRPASAPAPARPGPRSSVPCAPNFGKNAGAPLETLDDRDLAWYRAAIERSLQDPTKAQYTARNQKMLAEIIDEQNRRFTR